MTQLLTGLLIKDKQILSAKLRFSLTQIHFTQIRILQIATLTHISVK